MGARGIPKEDHMTSGKTTLGELIAILEDPANRLGDDWMALRLSMAIGEVDDLWVCFAVRDGITPVEFVDLLRLKNTHVSSCIGESDELREFAITLMKERMQYVGTQFSVRHLMEQALTSRQPYKNGTVHSKVFKLLQETRPPY